MSGDAALGETTTSTAPHLSVRIAVTWIRRPGGAWSPGRDHLGDSLHPLVPG
jgi:hypothetical protein